MKLIFPKYYKNYNCLAEKCNDSCCSAGWEIDIDKKSLDYYNTISGDIGKKLKENIILSPTPLTQRVYQ